MAEKRIVIRISDPLVNGLGHLSRTLALCEFLNYQNIIYFIDKEIISPSSILLQTLPFPYFISDNTLDFYSFITSNDIVIFDSYNITDDIRTKTKRRCYKTISIVDIAKDFYPCDAIIHTTSNLKENDFLCEPNTKKFIGYEYALIKKVFFRPLPKTQRNGILISMGGLDPFNLSTEITKILLSLNFDGPIHIIYTEQYHSKTIQLLKELQHCYQHINLYSSLNAEEICNLMDSCKYGIFPASTTLLEALKRELICAFGYFIDNQYNNFISLSSLKAGYVLGNLQNTNLTTEIPRFLNSNLLPNKDISLLLGKNIVELKNFILE